MTRRISILAVALASVLAASAGAEVRWLSTTHNFGAFHEDDGTVECTFRYVNVGDAPLHITAARTSCGCTLPHYTREDVAPGDTAEVTVSYDPTGRPGRFSKNVYVETNTDPARTTLAVSGVVIGAPTTVAQRYPADFGPVMRFSRGAIMAGDVARGRMKTVFLEMYNAGTDTLRPAVVGTPAFIDAEWLPAEVAPGEQASLVCHVRTGLCKEWGLVADSVVIAPSAQSTEHYTLPATVIVSEDFSALTDADRAKAPAIEAEPERIDFGSVKKDGGPQHGCVRLRNAGVNPLEIRRVYCVDDGVEVSIDRTKIKKGKTAAIDISVDPALFPGRIINTKIIVISNDPTRPNLAVRAVAMVL